MSLEEVLARLRYAEDEVERAEAAEQLGSYEGKQVILALIQAMGDEDQLVQVAAMESLKRCRSDPAPYLRTALLDVSLLVRWGAAEMLASYSSPETEAALRLALGDESAHVRGAAARSLRTMTKGPATITELQRLLEDPDSFPRYQALLTLRALDPQLADETRIIQRDLCSDDPLTRVEAIHFVRENDKREWLDKIERLCEDPDFRVSRAATWAWERFQERDSPST
jgi:HEAT repeat protein